MSPDPSYAEYVAARWSSLYRLAVLLVAEERAAALVEAALVRASLHWHDVQQAPSPDEQVRVELARTAAEDFATVGTGHDLDALPTRQRAVVVLRCFDLLGDAEIARGLGCKQSEVEAKLTAGLGALGLSESEITAELERRSEATTVPPAPVEDLLARAGEERSRRRNRRLRRSGVVVALAVAALAVTNLRPSEHDRRRAAEAIPRALAGLPGGAAPQAAYSDGRTLTLPGGTVVLPHRPEGLLQAGNWVYLTYPSGVVEQVDARSLTTTTLTRSANGQVVADASGRHVAWLDDHAAEGPPWLTVRPTAGDPAAVQTQVQDPPPGRGALVLNGLNRSGDLVMSRPDEGRTWVWHTGVLPAPGRPVVEEVSGLGNGTVAQVTAEGLVVGHPLYYAAGELRDGTFFVEDELEARQADFSDPRGTRVLYLEESGRFGVRDRSLGGTTGAVHDVRLRLPAGVGEYAATRWEDEHHVLLDVSDASLPGGALVRCDVRTGGCETAAEFDGPHLLAH